MGPKRLPLIGVVSLLITVVSPGRPEDARIGELRPVWDAVLMFRQLVLKDYQQALKACASDKGCEQFKALDEAVWAGIDPVAGWSFFMNTSVLTVALANGPRALIAFYHPFSDVFLLTAWEVRQGRGFMTEAEIFMGDWIRGRASPPFDTTPLWRRGNIFLPASLGQAVADSVKSLEAAFRGWTGSDWRGRIGAAPEGIRMEDLNHTCAALMLAQSLQVVDRFVVAESGESEMLGALRLGLAMMMKQIGSGDLEKVLNSADMSLPSMKSILRRMPIDAFRQMFVISTVVGTEEAIAFMAPPNNADYCLSFYFSGSPDEIRLRRVDIVYYPGWYKSAIEMRPDGGGGQ
jgi:hypothetical protein